MSSNAIHAAAIESLNSQIAEANKQLNAALNGNGGDVAKIRRNLTNLHVALTAVQSVADEPHAKKQVGAEAATVREHLEARARKAEADFVEAVKSLVAYVRVSDTSPAAQYGTALSIFPFDPDLDWLRRTGALRA